MDGQRLLGITGGDGPGGSALTERIVAHDGALCRPFCRTDRGAIQKRPLRGSVPGPCFRSASARSLLGSLQPKRRCPAVGAFLRSEERRVGNECVSTCRSRWSP